MAYGDFSIDRAIAEFQLVEQYASLFPELQPVAPSAWLTEILTMGRNFALPGGSEKARSEFLIAPTLLELERYYHDRLAIYSGRNLDVAKDRGLVGECDFLIGRGPVALSVRAPVLAVVEAKRDDVEAGIGECMAQMVGAQMFNQTRQVEDSELIFGCVTTGEIWQFLRLEGTTLTVDRDRFYIDRLERILACFHACLDRVLA